MIDFTLYTTHSKRPDGETKIAISSPTLMDTKYKVFVKMTGTAAPKDIDTPITASDPMKVMQLAFNFVGILVEKFEYSGGSIFLQPERNNSCAYTSKYWVKTRRPLIT